MGDRINISNSGQMTGVAIGSGASVVIGSDEQRVIWKYTLALKDGPQTHRIPAGGKIVHVHMQDGWVTLWAEVDPKARKRTRAFYVHGTGHPITPGASYVGTAHGQDGLVWHVYEGD